MELNASEEENEKVIREVKTLQELIKEKNKAIGILEKTSDELEKRQKPQFEDIFEQVLARVKTKNINEEQFKVSFNFQNYYIFFFLNITVFNNWEKINHFMQWWGQIGFIIERSIKNLWDLNLDPRYLYLELEREL